MASALRRGFTANAELALLLGEPAVDAVVNDVAKQVTLVRLSDGEAARELADGKVVATITVPPGASRK